MSDTVPEVFADVADERERTLYESIYSALLITNCLTVFQAAEPTDLTKFVNAICAHLPNGPRFMKAEIENGLHDVHYALCEGAAMFRRNYCQEVPVDQNGNN